MNLIFGTIPPVSENDSKQVDHEISLILKRFGDEKNVDLVIGKSMGSIVATGLVRVLKPSAFLILGYPTHMLDLNTQSDLDLSTLETPVTLVTNDDDDISKVLEVKEAISKAGNATLHIDNPGTGHTYKHYDLYNELLDF